MRLTSSTNRTLRRPARGRPVRMPTIPAGMRGSVYRLGRRQLSRRKTARTTDCAQRRNHNYSIDINRSTQFAVGARARTSHARAPHASNNPRALSCWPIAQALCQSFHQQAHPAAAHAARMACSLLRAAVRATNRLATLRQAISSKHPVAASSTVVRKSCSPGPNRPASSVRLTSS